VSRANLKVKKFGEDFIASNADSGQKTSVQVSNLLLNKIASRLKYSVPILEKKGDGQTLGNQFEDCCAEFVESTFLKMKNLRPGKWVVEKVATRASTVLGKYEQYAHLAELARLSDQYSELKSFLGDGYTIAPDVI
jgi:hypothetical protein